MTGSGLHQPGVISVHLNVGVPSFASAPGAKPPKAPAPAARYVNYLAGSKAILHARGAASSSRGILANIVEFIIARKDVVKFYGADA